MIKKVPCKYIDLPGDLASLIGEKKFLYAYFIPERNRFVVHHFNMALRNGDEIEFDVDSGRLLSNDERLADAVSMPAIVYSDENVFCRAEYVIRQPDSELYVKLFVVSSRGNTELTQLDQCFYPPVDFDISKLIFSALAALNFPIEFSTWDESARVGYFANLIHHFRRSEGEIGHSEDDAFSMRLVDDFKKLDPDFLSLLPSVLSLVGKMEQTEPKLMIEKFLKRVPELNLFLAKN